MPKPKIAKVGPATKRVQREKTEVYKKTADRIAAAREAKGMPDLDQSALARFKRTTLGKGMRAVHAPQTTEVKKQTKKK